MLIGYTRLVCTPIWYSGAVSRTHPGMGQVSAKKDIRVLLKDRDMKGLARGEGQIAKNMDGKLKKRHAHPRRTRPLLPSLACCTRRSLGSCTRCSTRCCTRHGSSWA